MKLRLLFLFLITSAIIQAKPVHSKDSLIKSIKLKNNYTLAFRHHDSINLVAIEQGKSSIELAEGEADTSETLESLGHLYADFDSTFALAAHVDATPIKVYIYSKRTGGILMYGATPFYLDTVKGLLMYEGAYGKYGKLFLFNATTGKAEIFDAPVYDTPCFCCSCWKVADINDKEVKIEYVNKKQEKVIKTYPRSILNPSH
jgi:hypothetical protein